MTARFSNRHRFADWPNSEIPLVAAGVYVIWDADLLVYCGMSGREFEAAVTAARKRYGLLGRLNSHAGGRLSGNQFCVYVANRLVIPSLQSSDLERFRTGNLTLDRLTREYIRDRFEYQYAVVDSSKGAYALERSCRLGHEFGVKPLLNAIDP
jgi:hypothetical protein